MESHWDFFTPKPLGEVIYKLDFWGVVKRDKKQNHQISKNRRGRCEVVDGIYKIDMCVNRVIIVDIYYYRYCVDINRV